VIVLGIESATNSVSAAVRTGEHTGASVRVDGRRLHTESLAPAVAQVLERAGTDVSTLEAIAVDVGPGLFTGLRVGVATAKGLAQGLGIGVLGLTSLEILAAAAFDAGWPGAVLAVIDARRGEVFAAQYTRGRGPVDTVELSVPARYRPERVVVEAMAPGEHPVLACGDGALRYRALLEGCGRITAAGEGLAAPDARVLVSMAVTRLEAGTPLVAAGDLEPVYLREPDARIGWVERRPVPEREG